MGRKKKKHIIFYDKELGDNLDDLKKFEGITYDELLKKYLKLPKTDDLIQMKFEDVRDLLIHKYKNEDIYELMSLLWIIAIKSAQGEFDIKKLKYDIEADIRMKTYKKR
jgi:hypothetical protein